MIQDLFAGKKICILGFGKEGRSMLAFLEKLGVAAEITIADKSNTLAVPNYAYQGGEHYLQGLENFDLIIKSPGIPPAPELADLGDRLTSSTQLMLEICAQQQATLIGITGTQGKSTTASLIYAILQEAGLPCLLAGNIGQPASDYFDQIKAGMYVVEEMSSYQLLDVRQSPPISVITSFHPDHLDYHGSLEDYREAKKNITRFQRASDIVFYTDTPACQELAIGEGQKVPVGVEEAPVRIEETKLRGTHNLQNIALAYKVALQVGVAPEVAIKAIKVFSGLPHRLEFVSNKAGIQWVDDAIATTPEATLVALETLGKEVATVILGGLDRGYDFTELIQYLATSSIQTLLMFPGSGERLTQELQAVSHQLEVISVRSMSEAVQEAFTHTKAGEICLLSTASPSYGLFRNFEDKGEQFLKAVQEYDITNK